MSLLNVLLVSYSFPPAGGVGVLRAASLARHFPDEGIRLDVLTTRNASAVGSDYSLLQEIPGDVAVHRTVTLDLPFAFKKRIKEIIVGEKRSPAMSIAGSVAKPSLLKRMLQDVLLPDPQVTWLPVLVRTAMRLIRTRNIDVVLITVPPFSSMLLVEKLRKKFPELPIVLDFRDEWLSTTLNLVSFSRTKRALEVARSVEAAAVRNATVVVTVTQSARREIRRRYPQEPEQKFQLVPNGFDASKLRNLGSKRTHRLDGKIIVSYIGTLYGSTEPTTLIRALQLLPPELRSRFIFRFIGHIEELRFRESLLELGEMVDIKGFLPQQEALAAMSETDYVLIISHDPLNVGAKFYDYVGGGKPILASIHADGETRRLLEEFRAGWWAANRDIEGIRQLFVDAAAHANSLHTAFQPDEAKIAQYERKVLAKQYANLLHSILDQQSKTATDTQTARLS